MQARRKSKGVLNKIHPSDSVNVVRVTNLDLDDGLSGEQRACVECVLRIINNFIEKLQVALVMPHILAASTELIEEDFKEAGLNVSAIKTLNFHLADDKVFQLQQIIEKNINKTKLWGKWLIFLTVEDEALINNLNTLYKITKMRLSKSALSDLSKGKKLFKLEQNVAAFGLSIAETEESLCKQKFKNLWKLGYRAALIHKYEEDYLYQKWNNNMRIKQEIVRSSGAIKNVQDFSYLKLSELENEVMEKRLIYNKLLREDLLLEKQARNEKKKLLFQLQTYIRKYDQNVGDKIKENLKLQDEYLAKKAKFDEFMIKYCCEEKNYFTIVEQKEKEEQLLFEQKLMVFMMSRAARAIQVRWRRFRRDQKKKSKKKGKGKKK